MLDRWHPIIWSSWNLYNYFSWSKPWHRLKTNKQTNDIFFKKLMWTLRMVVADDYIILTSHNGWSISECPDMMSNKLLATYTGEKLIIKDLFIPALKVVLLLIGETWMVQATCWYLKGNTTAIFNKSMLESMSIQILPTYCFCCTILLIIKINKLCSPPVGIHFLCETTDQTQ